MIVLVFQTLLENPERVVDQESILSPVNTKLRLLTRVTIQLRVLIAIELGMMWIPVTRRGTMVDALMLDLLLRDRQNELRLRRVRRRQNEC
jgi:hypothetical protein